MARWQKGTGDTFGKDGWRTNIQIIHGYDGTLGNTQFGKMNLVYSHQDRSSVILNTATGFMGNQTTIFQTAKAYNPSSIRKAKSQAIQFAKSYMRSH